MAMRREKKRKDPFNKEKAVNPCDHSQNLPQILLSFCKVFVIMTLSVIVEAKDLQRRQRGKQLDLYSRVNREYLYTCVAPESQLQRMVQWLCVLYLWYEVQECISWEGSHCQAHKELQDECVGLLAGVEEDQADTEHGAQRDEQDSSRAVAVLCRQNIKIKDSRADHNTK